MRHDRSGERGAGAVELGMLVSGIAAVLVAGAVGLGQQVEDQLICFTEQLAAKGTASCGRPDGGSGAVDTGGTADGMNGAGQGTDQTPSPTGSPTQSPSPEPTPSPTESPTTETAAPTDSPGVPVG